MLFILILLLLTSAISCEFSNLDSIRSLSHDYGNLTDDAKYNSCIRDKMAKVGGGFIFGPFYKFVIEFSVVSLPCSPCSYSNALTTNSSWTKLTFENKFIPLTSDETYEIGADESLVLKSVQEQDFGTYYCQINGHAGHIWSLEVERFRDFDVMKARHMVTAADLNLPGMRLTTRWEAWSDCNKCDQVGKRHRIGYCHAQGVPGAPYKALEVYKDGLSCNLFLLIHPDLDPEIIQDLAVNPTIAIGYCKVPCDYFPADPGIAFESVHPKIVGIYKEQVRMVAEEEYERKIKANAGAGRKFLPGKPTRFEATVLILMLALQLYIIVHVCKNRSKAV